MLCKTSESYRDVFEAEIPPILIYVKLAAS